MCRFAAASFISLCPLTNTTVSSYLYQSALSLLTPTNHQCMERQKWDPKTETSNQYETLTSTSTSQVMSSLLHLVRCTQMKTNIRTQIPKHVPTYTETFPKYFHVANMWVQYLKWIANTQASHSLTIIIQYTCKQWWHILSLSPQLNYWALFKK